MVKRGWTELLKRKDAHYSQTWRRGLSLDGRSSSHRHRSGARFDKVFDECAHLSFYDEQPTRYDRRLDTTDRAEFTRSPTTSRLISSCELFMHQSAVHPVIIWPILCYRTSNSKHVIHGTNARLLPVRSFYSCHCLFRYLESYRYLNVDIKWAAGARSISSNDDITKQRGRGGLAFIDTVFFPNACTVLCHWKKSNWS